MGVLEKYKDNLIYYEIQGFKSDFSMDHLFTSRIGWDQKNIFKDLSKVLNIPEKKIYRTKQVHGNDVLVINDQNYKKVFSKERDGLITNVKGIALATYHADCVPIYFYDMKNNVIGLAHGGWKGTLNNIAKTIIEKMIKEFGSRIEDIVVAIGPSIGVCCYEVGQDVVKLFLEKHSNNKDIIVEKDGKTYLNLWKVNNINLLKLGINKEKIYNSNFCTSCRIDKLFSYRKENGTKNRMIAAIKLK